MSARRTKQLRRECARRLGRAPLKADGHITMRAGSVPATGRTGKPAGLLRRVWLLLKPADRLQVDEFRFFKRHGCTPGETAARRAGELAARRRHEAEVDRHNESMEALRRARVAEVAA
jgi:hypothetical protein